MAKYYVMKDSAGELEVVEDDQMPDAVARGFRVILPTDDLQEAVAAKAVMASNPLARLVSMQGPHPR